MNMMDVNTYTQQAIVFPIDLTKENTRDVLLKICKNSGIDPCMYNDVGIKNSPGTNAGELLCGLMKNKYVIFCILIIAIKILHILI